MIFVGDIALPFSDSIAIQELPEVFDGKNWFGNLEGAVVDFSEALQKQYVVFNDKASIRTLTDDFDFVAFATANNHIFDTGTFETTTEFLREINIPYVGIGDDLEEAQKPFVFKEGRREVVILNFGWEVIQCEVINGNGPGVNPLRKDHVLESVEKAIRDYPDAYVLPFMHWSYELEDTPQPFERQLAKKLIDMGVAGVIGCHPHRIGGFEMYKGKPIVYSLGNWMFKQDYYHNGKLRFPAFCNLELAFEWDFESDEFKFHFFEFDQGKSEINYLRTETGESPTMAELTPFRGLSDQEYKKWYKKNHYHKNKGLPIYYWEDSDVAIAAKNKVNKVRDFFISQLSKFR